MTIKEMRASTGLSQSKFAALFSIPTGTFQAWEQGRQEPPKYVLVMMERLLHMKSMKTDFNPFYDSEYLISYQGDESRRMLVEMFPDELIDLRAEINAVLEGRGKNE